MSTNATHNYRKVNYGTFMMAEGTVPYDGGWVIMANVLTSNGGARFMWPMDDDGVVCGLVTRPTDDEWEAYRAWMAGRLSGDDITVAYPKVEEGRLV